MNKVPVVFTFSILTINTFCMEDNSPTEIEEYVLKSLILIVQSKTILKNDQSPQIPIADLTTEFNSIFGEGKFKEILDSQFEEQVRTIKKFWCKKPKRHDSSQQRLFFKILRANGTLDLTKQKIQHAQALDGAETLVIQ